MNNKLLGLAASVAALVLGVLPLSVSAAVLASTLTVSNTSPVVGQTISVSGECGAAGANSTASFALSRGNVNTSLGTTVSTNSTGGFSGNVTIPSNFGSGAATLVATCTNSGDTINSPVLNIQAPPGTTISSSPSSAAINSGVTISGNCPAALAGGAVKFSLLQNASSTTLPALQTTINSNGSFSALVGLVANASTGPAVIILTCPDNSTTTAAITLTPAIPGDTSFPVASGTANSSGNVAGSVSQVPTGGVAAGSEPASSLPIAGIALLLLGALSVAAAVLMKSRSSRLS